MKKVQITVARTVFWSMGPRTWFVIQATDGTRYQRWSLDMNTTN